MIYIAKFEDIKTIIKMSLNIPKEHGFENLPPVNLMKVGEFFYSKFEDYPIFIYKDDKDKIVGFLGIQLTDFWWSTQEVVNDYIFYVDPKHRRPEVANALIEAMRDFAKLNNMPVVSNVISNDRTEAKQRLYTSKGFKPSGVIMTYGV